MEKEKLIRSCLDKVEELIGFEKGMTCLVTADSSLFLRRVEAIDGVKTIPGKVVHPGTGAKGDFHLYSKSFVDFYLLSESTKIYSVVYGDMYPSEFPLYASKLNNIPFERIIEK